MNDGWRPQMHSRDAPLKFLEWHQPSGTAAHIPYAASDVSLHFLGPYGNSKLSDMV